MSFILKYRFYLLTILISTLSFGIGFFVHKHQIISNTLKEQRENSSEFKFTNPLLECDAGQDTELRSFEKQINSSIYSYQQTKNITEAAVYFRDLNNGLFFSVGSTEKFSPASLLKIPLMLAYFKEQENNPKIFSQDIIYTKEYDLYGKQAIKPEIMLEQGKTYNVKDLIGRMVVYSDNSAQQMLMKNAQSFWRTPYKDLGIDMPEDTQAENFMSVVDYARFFRILYNASYLNKQNSNITLGILTQTTFKDGLVAGIPPNILVAHKFGERSLGDIKQLHDCGIVYYPSRPYLLCIMTRGTDFNNLKKVIAKISKEVYSQVDIQTNK